MALLRKLKILRPEMHPHPRYQGGALGRSLSVRSGDGQGVTEERFQVEFNAREMGVVESNPYVWTWSVDRSMNLSSFQSRPP